jgi:hypothetical protein
MEIISSNTFVTWIKNTGSLQKKWILMKFSILSKKEQNISKELLTSYIQLKSIFFILTNHDKFIWDTFFNKNRAIAEVAILQIYRKDREISIVTEIIKFL